MHSSPSTEVGMRPLIEGLRGLRKKLCISVLSRARHGRWYKILCSEFSLNTLDSAMEFED